MQSFLVPQILIIDCNKIIAYTQHTNFSPFWQRVSLVWHLSDVSTVAKISTRELKLQTEIHRTGWHGKLPNDSGSISHNKSDILPFLPGNKLCQAEGVEIEGVQYLPVHIWQDSLGLRKPCCADRWQLEVLVHRDRLCFTASTVTANPVQSHLRNKA